MKFSIILTALLGTVSALPHGGADRIRSRARQSRPKDGTNLVVGDQGKVKYSSNWAGAVRENPPPHSHFNDVSATFVVPQPFPGYSSGSRAASAWVGIDGDTYSKAILQTGIDFVVENGKTKYDAWFEWYPNYAYNFQMPIHGGDIVTAKVHAYSPSYGVAIIQNHSTGQNASKTLHAPNPTATLAGRNAEWIVEDFTTNGEMVNLLDFGKIAFDNTIARVNGSNLNYGVQGATIMELQQQGNVLTEVTLRGDKQLIVEYTG